MTITLTASDRPNEWVIIPYPFGEMDYEEILRRLEAAAVAGLVERPQQAGRLQPRPDKAVCASPLTGAEEISKARERLDEATRLGLLSGTGGKLTPPAVRVKPKGKKPVSDFIIEDRERR
jgi:hypothetical protein